MLPCHDELAQPLWPCMTQIATTQHAQYLLCTVHLRTFHYIALQCSGVRARRCPAETTLVEACISGFKTQGTPARISLTATPSTGSYVLSSRLAAHGHRQDRFTNGSNEICHD